MTPNPSKKNRDVGPIRWYIMNRNPTAKNAASTYAVFSTAKLIESWTLVDTFKPAPAIQITQRRVSILYHFFARLPHAALGQKTAGVRFATPSRYPAPTGLQQGLCAWQADLTLPPTMPGLPPEIRQSTVNSRHLALISGWLPGVLT